MDTRSRSRPGTLDLCVPGLTGRAGWGPLGVAPRAPALERMLSRCRRALFPPSGYEQTLCVLAGMVPLRDQELPLGRILDGCRPGPAGGLLCAEPVFLRADLSRLHLLPLGAPDIGPGDTRALIELFNRHFESRGWRLRVGAAGAWLLEDRDPVAVATMPAGEAAGRELRSCLPRGPGAARLQALMNETQMLFHDSGVNRSREQRGLLPVNGLWLYGGGGLTAPPSVPWQAVWAAEPLARALAALTRSGPCAPPAAFEGPVHGRVLLCLMDLRGPVALDDPGAWAGAVSRLERDWFGPIAAALRSGILAECRLYDCAGRVCFLRRADRWRLWRPIVPLNARLGESDKHEAHP